jgi:hypothetical protein
VTGQATHCTHPALKAMIELATTMGNDQPLGDGWVEVYGAVQAAQDIVDAWRDSKTEQAYRVQKVGAVLLQGIRMQ